jgi:glycine/D-amino acid oxidase-like deaminating enzyme
VLGLARHLQILRRAGIPILWQTRPIALLGTHRVEALAVEGPAGQQVLPADTVALHWGIQADTGMARALGAAHRVTDGRLQTIIDPAGRTSLPGLFAVTDTGRVALHRGRIAGLAAAAALGFHTPHPPYAALRRAERAQRALRHAFAATPPDPAALPDDTILCRCEAVTAGALRAATRAGAASLATLKRATRAGMGPCAGRLCSATIARLTGATTEAGFAAPRLPFRPVPAAALLADHPDPADRVIPAPPPLHWTTAAPSTHLGARPDNADIVVIGAGLIGLSTALYLARDGRDVLLLDRGEPGMAASTANAGSLHVQLVPYVYAANGGGPMAHALPLGPASIALWRDLADEAGEDLGIRTEGGLILAETEAEMKLLRSKAAFERCRGIPAQVIGPAELRALAPGLAGIFAGASFCPLEGQGDPLRGTMALLSLAHRAGVRVAGGIEVTGLECAAPGWTVRTAAGPIRAGQVVNTAGVQVMRVGAYAGVAVPGHALVQQVIATAPGPTMLRQLVAWTGRHLSLKQGNGGHILIGGGWPGTLDGNGAAQLDRQSIEGNLALASRALPALRHLNVVRAWTGLAPNQSRPPLISATPGQPGLFHAMTGNGYTLAPVIGRILADAIRTSAPLPPAFAL